MKAYTEEMRMNNEYPEVGQSVILNLLVEHEGLKKYNGSELLVVDITPSGLPLFHCRGYGFYVSLNNSHFKAVPPNGAETETPEEASEFYRIEMVNRVNNESEDWPQVGDEVCWSNGKRKGELKSICEGWAWIKDDSGEFVSLMVKYIKKPKSKEDLLIEELQTKLIKSSAVDSWMLATDILNGKIKGLTYKGDSGENL